MVAIKCRSSLSVVFGKLGRFPAGLKVIMLARPCGINYAIRSIRIPGCLPQGEDRAAGRGHIIGSTSEACHENQGTSISPGGLAVGAPDRTPEPPSGRRFRRVY